MTRKRRIRDYQPRQGWQSGPKEAITDDTQLTMWLAESILEVASKQVAQRPQVLVLTRHPERYRGLTGANFVDLEGIVRGDG